MTFYCKKTPIGFFHSGVGGLTVLRAFLTEMGSFPFHYLADSAHCPYGDRPLEEVKRFALEATDYLIEQGCKTVIMACNISSSIALEEAEKNYPDVAVLGLINSFLGETVKQLSTTGRVGVLATTGTVNSQRYPEVLSRYGLEVYQQPCPPLVPLVEAELTTGPEVEKVLKELLENLLKEGPDTIILGCTHYPFLSSSLKKVLPAGIKLLDPGQILAKKLAGTVKSNGKKADFRISSTATNPTLQKLLNQLPGMKNSTVTLAETKPIQIN